MKRTVTCALIAVLAVLSAVTPATATRVKVQMQQPRMIDADTAQLKGWARGRDAVRIQRFVENRGRWVTVRKVRVDRRGVFRTRVEAGARRTTYRAVVGQARSAVRSVPAAEPVQDLPPPPTDDCGPRPRKADGTHWACTLVDEFEGTELDRSLWVPQYWFRTGLNEAFACYRDDPSVISVSGGSLHLGLRELPAPFLCGGAGNLPTRYLAGMVSTWERFSQQYGRFEARIRVTDVDGVGGLHEAFWMWPDQRYKKPGDKWPAAGEIDVSETFSEHPISLPYLHYGEDDNGGPKPGLNTALDCYAPRGRFHTYTLEWTADRIEIFVNGTSCLVNEEGDPAFDKPYHIVFTEGLNINFLRFDPRVRLPVSMDVDYVKVWK